MKLVASLIVRNELGRYLELCIQHLLEFCDQICVVDDGSTDGTREWLNDNASLRLKVMDLYTERFLDHEGKARQNLLEWTMQADPTHILAIDADEFVSSGHKVREACEKMNDVHTLSMEEVWELDGRCICIREDGGWRAHPVPCLYRVPRHRDENWQIIQRQLACGREPLAIRRMAAYAQPTGAQILHFGWARKAERQARYDRYVVADGGQFHASAHLQSIMWPDDQVQLRGRRWPAGLKAIRADLTGRVERW